MREIERRLGRLEDTHALGRWTLSPLARIGLEKLAAGASVSDVSDEELDAIIDAGPLRGSDVRSRSDADLEALVGEDAQRVPALARAVLNHPSTRG